MCSLLVDFTSPTNRNNSLGKQTNHKQSSPPRKKYKTPGNMKDGARDSLPEFQSSIFDASDGHKLVDFIRKKKGLSTKPQTIFDDVQTDRPSLQVEIQWLNEAEKTLQHGEPCEPLSLSDVGNDVQFTGTESAKCARQTPMKSPAFTDPKLKLKRSSRSIGRRMLLKEFEKTLRESRFFPPTCSTPLSIDSPDLPSAPTSNANEKSLSKATNTAQEKTLNLNLVCTPITIDDEDSPAQALSKELSAKNTTAASNNNTESVMRGLQEQNDYLLELAISDEEIADRNQDFPEPLAPIKHKEKSAARCSSPPIRKTNRHTFTVHRDTISGNLSLSPGKSSQDNSIRQPILPKTPLKNLHTNSRKLIATPEQKKLLLSKFSRLVASSPQKTASSQKTSRIPVIMKGTAANLTSKENQDVQAAETTYEVTGNKETAQINAANGETAQIIEQLQNRALSNAPVIVIPVNQTFNQVPRDVSQTTAQPATYVNSPSSNEILSTTKTNIPQPETVKTPVPNKKGSTSVNKLRLADIITDDESSSSDDNQPLAQVCLIKEPTRRKPFNTSKNQRLSTRYQNVLSLRVPPPRSSSHMVRELLTSNQLSELSVDEVLDLRKRNSHGELRKTLNLTKRESTLLDKQVELELLRRNIQERNCEDEVLQMEVLPPPPEDFSDKRKSLELHKTMQPDAHVVEDDLIDEISADRISLSQEPAHLSSVSRNGRRPRKKKMSEQLEKYLGASQTVSKKSKYLNVSKRKLYSKGNSDASSSDDFSPNMSPNRCLDTQREMSKACIKSNKHVPVKSNDSQRIPADHPSYLPPLSPQVNESREKKQFLPNNSKVFKRPKGRPPKAATQQSQRRNRSPAVINEKKDTTTSNSSSPVPAPPVDPDEVRLNSNMDESSVLRRSKRGRKPLRAYWTCSQKDYIPLYDIGNMLAAKKNASFLRQMNSGKRKTKNSSSNKDNLVVNTKKNISNSVDKTQNNKKSNNKQTKREEGKSKQQSNTATTSSECSLTLRKLKPTSNKLIDSDELDREGTKSQSTRQSSKDSSPSVGFPLQLSPIIEDAVPVRHHTSRILEKPSKSKSKNRYQTSKDAHENLLKDNAHQHLHSKSKSKKSHQPSTDSDENSSQEVALQLLSSRYAPENSSKDDVPQENPSEEDAPQLANITRKSANLCKIKSKSKEAKLKKRQTSIDSQTISSDCSSKDYPSSIQQLRLASIAEHSAYEFGQQVTINVSDSDANKNRLSATLMPPPPSRVVKKKSKKTFRTEHDETIADASSEHVNKLFDQMKNYSMCVAAEDTAQRVTNTGQVSLSSRAKDHTATEPKCRNLTVRLLRMKSRKALPESSEKVCDSGFSSEDMSSDPKVRGDILLSWLKQIVRSGKSPSGSNKGVAKFLQSDGLHTASADDLIFEEIDGVDYAFYNTKQQFSFGYIRFNPKTEKKKCRVKKFELNFVVLCGAVTITANGNSFDYKNGDLVTIFVGTSYSIKNISNDPALVMVIKK